MTEEDKGRVKTVTLRIGARAKKERERGREEKNTAFSLLPLLTPSPAAFDSPRFLLSFGVST